MLRLCPDGSTAESLNGEIVLVHGLVRSKQSMSPLAYLLRKEGYTVHNFGYPSHKTVVSTHTDALRRFLHERLGGRKPDLYFITHSLGSIISRDLDRRFGDEFRLKRIAMMGPPNQGALIARALCRIPGMKRLFGPCLPELGNMSLPPQTKHFEVGIIAGGTGLPFGFFPLLPGDNDFIVRVEETPMEGMKDFRQLFIMHALMMFHPKTCRACLRFLHTGSFHETAESSAIDDGGQQ